MSSDFELFPRLLVDVRGAKDAVFIFHRRQWNRTGDLCACAFGSVNDLARGLVQDAIVVGFKPDANSFVAYHFSLDPLPAVPEERTCGELRAAWCRFQLAFAYVARTLLSARPLTLILLRSFAPLDSRGRLSLRDSPTARFLKSCLRLPYGRLRGWRNVGLFPWLPA